MARVRRLHRWWKRRMERYDDTVRHNADAWDAENNRVGGDFGEGPW